MTNTPHPYPTTTTPPDIMRVVVDIAATRSTKRTAKVFRVHPRTMSRILAGEPIAHGTLALLRQACAQIAADRAESAALRQEQAAR